MHCCLDCRLEKRVEPGAGPNTLCKAVDRTACVRGNISCCQESSDALSLI